MNLEQLTVRAACIFLGRCTTSRTARDAVLNLDVTTLHFDVDLMLKGEPRRTVCFRQCHLRPSHGPDSLGTPGFAVGETALVFLWNAGDGGLTTPVGLGLGKFGVTTDALGRQVAANVRGNRGLLRGLTPQARRRIGARSPAATQGQPLPLEELLDLVRLLQDTAPAHREPVAPRA